MAVAVSQNGWPVNPPRTARTIPGTGVKVTVADGPAGDVLMFVLSQVDKRVEDIDMKSTRGEFDDWGYADRSVRGSTDTSNHASATAVDVNATRHVLGARGTFTLAQVAEIHRILAEVDHVVRWGGDYSGRRDEMHFEINADKAAVTRVAARLNPPAPPPFRIPPPKEDDVVVLMKGDKSPNVYAVKIDPTLKTAEGEATAAVRCFVPGPIGAALLAAGNVITVPQTAFDSIAKVEGSA